MHVCALFQNRCLARQKPGKEYTLQECLTILRVPTVIWPRIIAFGSKSWVNGAEIPRLWVGKELSLANVKGKIRNIMRMDER